MAIAFIYNRRPGAAVVIPDPHVHSYVGSFFPPTCTKQGYTNYLCEDCGHFYNADYVPALGHNYNEAWESDESGHWHTCSRCGEKGETIPHVPSEATEGTDQVCMVCGYVITRHECSYSENWESDESGHWKVCTICGEPSEKESHTPGAEATEFTAQVCTICGHVITPPLGHTHSYTYEVIAPTCTERGYTIESCSCGIAYKRNYTPALGHDKQSTVTKAPTCEEEGNRYWWCTRCGWSENEVLPALGHDNSGEWERMMDGSGHFHRCLRCGWAPLDFDAHTFKTICDKYSDSQHKLYNQCTVCGETTDAKYLNHDFNIKHEPYINPDGTVNLKFHESTYICSTCHYYDTRYENHEFEIDGMRVNKVCKHCGFTIPL